MTKEQLKDANALDKLISAEEYLYNAIKESAGSANVIIPNDNKLKSQILIATMTRIAELKEQFAAI